MEGLRRNAVPLERVPVASSSSDFEMQVRAIVQSCLQDFHQRDLAFDQRFTKLEQDMCRLTGMQGDEALPHESPQQDAHELSPIDNAGDPLAPEDEGMKRTSTILTYTIENVTQQSYEIEKSVYGAVVTPGRNLGFGAWMLLLVHYTVTAFLCYLIWAANEYEHDEKLSVILGAKDSLGAKDPICQQRGDDWDCTPKGYTELSDFGSLDVDGDGYWSVAEASQRNLLQQFSAVHQVARQSTDFLMSVLPATRAKMPQFCNSVKKYARHDDQYAKISYIEQFLDDAFSNATRVDEILYDTDRKQIEDKLVKSCPAGHTPEYMKNNGFGFGSKGFAKFMKKAIKKGYIPKHCSSMNNCSQTGGQNWTCRRWCLSASCLWESLCTNVSKVIPEKSSLQQYEEKTRYMSVISRQMHELLRRNLLRPCRLVNPNLCANVEVRSPEFLRAVPWLADLPPDKRVNECRSFVEERCPLIFGSDYQNMQLKVDGSCGDARFKTEVVVTPKPVLETPIECFDRDEDARTVFKAIRDQDNIMNAYFSSVETGMGAPVGMFSTVGCSLYATFNDQTWCGETSSLPLDPLIAELVRSQNISDTISSSVGSLLGRLCSSRDACCKESRLHLNGCPASCIQQFYPERQGNRWETRLGEFACTGVDCKELQTKLDNVSGSLKIIFEPEKYHFDSKIKAYRGLGFVARSDLNMRIYILSMQVGSIDDVNCFGNALVIEGLRVCRGNAALHPHIDVALKTGEVEVLFLPVSPCTKRNPADKNCSFELLFTDKGVSESVRLPVADFPEHRLYWDPLFGKTSTRFGVFLSVILFVWVCFVLLELEQIFHFTVFILQCPVVASNRSRIGGLKKRMFYLVFVVVPRLGICFFVLTIGVNLLSASRTLMDCVLNNVALAFILDLDNLLFSLLAPGQLRRQMDELGVIVWPSSSRALQSDARLVLLALVMVLVTASILVFLYSGPQGYHQLAAIMDCMCFLEGEHCSEAVSFNNDKVY